MQREPPGRTSRVWLVLASCSKVVSCPEASGFAAHCCPASSRPRPGQDESGIETFGPFQGSPGMKMTRGQPFFLQLRPGESFTAQSAQAKRPRKLKLTSCRVGLSGIQSSLAALLLGPRGPRFLGPLLSGPLSGHKTPGTERHMQSLKRTSSHSGGQSARRRSLPAVAICRYSCSTRGMSRSLI